jgi:hypothetical protein
MRDYTQPTWGFTYNDGEGNITTKSFSTKSETWIEALSRFLDFTRGVGYTVANNAVALNADIEADECAWSGNYYISGGVYPEDDWSHPEDSCPPFQGNPQDCAFEAEPVPCPLEEFLRGIVKVKGGAV